MKYQIGGQGWPVDQWLIPTGTVIDDASEDQWSTLVRQRGLKPPINATALDTEAWQAQLAAYPEHRHLLGSGPKP
jgi:hypothetical protein